MAAHTLPPHTAKRRQLVAVITLLVVAAAIFAALWFATRHNALHAEVGDCLHKTGSDTVKVIDCGSPDADFTVLGRVEDQEEIASTISITSVCDQWKDQATNTYWEGEQGKKGTVLCLAKK